MTRSARDRKPPERTSEDDHQAAATIRVPQLSAHQELGPMVEFGRLMSLVHCSLRPGKLLSPPLPPPSIFSLIFSYSSPSVSSLILLLLLYFLSAGKERGRQTVTTCTSHRQAHFNVFPELLIAIKRSVTFSLRTDLSKSDVNDFAKSFKQKFNFSQQGEGSNPYNKVELPR